MIFEEIRITNLFSYFWSRGLRVAHSDCPGLPLILISGRNGFGKTSFINSVKLLFLGTSADMLQQVIDGTKLRPNSYLLGHGKSGAAFSIVAPAKLASPTPLWRSNQMARGPRHRCR
jgi:hypothetical protein